MASIFDVISGLARKGNEAAQSTQAKTLVADVSKLAAEKKKKMVAQQAAIDASIKKAGVKPSVISAPSSAPIDTGLTDLAQKAQSFPQLEGLLLSNKPVSVQNEETKNVIQNLFSRIKKPVVDMGASAIQNLNPIAAFLNKTNVPALKNAADFVGNKEKIANFLSGSITGAVEQPASNLFESMQALRKKQEARTNTTMGDRFNDLLSSGTMTAGAAISALPIAAQYNAAVGGLKGNEQTKGLGEGIDTVGSLPTQGLRAAVSILPITDEMKDALVMAGNFGLLKVGSKVGEGLQKRIGSSEYTGSFTTAFTDALKQNKNVFTSGLNVDPIIKAVVAGEKALVKNPVIQSLDPTGLTSGAANVADTANIKKQDPLIEEAKKYKSAEEFVKNKMVDAKGSSFVYQKNTPNNAYTFAEDGHVIKKGDLVKEYMNGSASFVEANTTGNVGKIVTNQAPYLVITPQTKQQLTDIYNKAQGGEQPIPPVPPKKIENIGDDGIPSRADGAKTQDNKTFDPDKYVKEQTAKRENAKKSETPTIKDRIMNTWSNIKTKLVDSTAPIEDILYRVKNKNKDNFSIPPSKDIHNQIDNVYRTTDIAGQFMKNNGLKSIIENVDNLDNLDQYLVAKHGQTLIKNGVETGRDPVKDAALVDSFAPKYEAQAQQVTAYSRKLLDYAVDAGVVSKETAQALKEKYPDYVPFNRVFNDDGTFNSIGGKSVANLSKQSVIQKIIGSKREVESPLQSLLQKTHEVFIQGEKNKAGKMLSEYISLPDNPFQLKKINEVKDASDGMGTVSFYKDGVKQVYETSPEIANAAKSLGVQQLNILGKIFAAPVRIARIGITGLNIPFIGANIVKDNVSAFINSKNSLRTSVANPKVFIQSLLQAVGHGKLYQEMVGEGGGGTSFNMSRNNAGKTLEEIRAGRNIGSQIKYTITHPSQLVKAVEDIIARGEEFTRISQYKGTKDAMLAKGMSEKEARIEAARQARDTTVNFARKGEWGTVLNSAFMFLNANIQGTRTLLRRLKEDPLGTSTKIATVGLLPMAMVTAWNLEDDKKKQVYDDIADYEKENNFIVIPENATKDEKGKWNVIKIPLSPDIKNLLNISRRLVEQAHGKDPVAFGEFTKSLLSTASPIGLDQQSLISTLTPQAIKPTIEAVQNKSLFTGFPIVPRSLEGKLPEDQVKDNTSGFARILGKQIGQSPIQVEQFIKSTFGGVGSQATNAVDTVLNKAGVIPSNQIGGQGILEGILGRFMKAQGGNIENQQWEKEAQNKQLLLKNKIELTPERKAEVAAFDQRKQSAKLERDRNTLLEIQKLAKDGTEEEASKAILNEYPRLSPAAVSKIIKDTREGKVY